MISTPPKLLLRISIRPYRTLLPAPVTLHWQQGMTLIELVLSIVIISVAVVGVMQSSSFSVGRSADPLLQYQSIAIAESYLEEVLLQAYADPDGVEAGETRATFDDVLDYNGLVNNGIRDQADNAIAALSGYNAAIAVTGPVAISGQAAYQVTVTVANPTVANLTTLSLVGYRFPDPVAGP